MGCFKAFDIMVDLGSFGRGNRLGGMRVQLMQSLCAQPLHQPWQQNSSNRGSFGVVYSALYDSSSRSASLRVGDCC